MVATRRAFSLLELTVVVVIVATAAVIVVPRVMGVTQRSRLKAACQRLVQDVEATRERARTLGVYQTFCFSSEGYTIVQRTPTVEEKVSVSLAEDPYHASIGWVKLQSGTELSFDPFGVPSSSACVKVTNGTDSYYVTISSGTGIATPSERKSATQAAAIDVTVTPTPIAVDIEAIVPAPRLTVKVRYDANAPSISVISAVTAALPLD